jgi:hypothetical protein
MAAAPVQKTPKITCLPLNRGFRVALATMAKCDDSANCHQTDWLIW